MKKHFIILVSLIAFLTISSRSQNTGLLPNQSTNEIPEWTKMMQDPNANFFVIQDIAKKYYENRVRQKGDGFKVFKRWENYWQSRVNADGTFPAPNATLNAYTEFFSNPMYAASISGTWTPLGPTAMPTNGTGQPNGLGRINCVVFHPTAVGTIYIGAPAGGLWRTTNSGSTWTGLTDNLPSLGVSSILIDHTNTNTLYLGTGDRDAGDAPGIGVYKSINGGSSWAASNSGMESATVNMMLMHPSNAQLILAATSSGIYKSINGGASWTKTSSNSNFKDIRFKPGTPTTVYAASGSNFYVSSNTGDTWTQVTSGLPGTGRYVIGVSAANSSVVYIMSGGNSGLVGVYKSVNSGTSFTTTCTTPNVLGYSETGNDNSSQAWYDLCIAVSPTDINTIYLGGVNIWKSTNGGVTFNINAHWVGSGGVPAVHADIHSLDFSPLNNNLYVGCDGGIYYTANGGTSYTEITSGLPISQIYRLGQSATNVNSVINGYQDNGTANYNGTAWKTVMGGDGMDCLIDPTNPNYQYGEVYYGNVSRTTNGTNFTDIAGNTINGINEDGGWVSPFVLHSTNPNTMFLGLTNLWRSTNVKAASASSITWTKITPFSSVAADQISVVEHSPANVDLLYFGVGQDIYRTLTCNAANMTWTSLSPGITANDIEAHPTNANIVYIVGGTSVYKSINQGNSWTNITGNLPAIAKNCIVYDTSSNEGLYVGTDAGVFYKDANMANWVPFTSGLPVNAEITDLEIYYGASAAERKIRASTYGRGTWSSDLYSVAPASLTVDFRASNTTPCTGTSVLFSDTTLGVPTAWQWTFSPNTVTYIGGTSSTSQNPMVVFNSIGLYNVTLYASNAVGNGTLTKTNFINVGSPLTTPMSQNFETFTVGAPGTLLDGWKTLNSGNFTWQVNAGPTASANTGPNVDHTLGTAAGKYLYTESSSPSITGEITSLISPCISIPASGSTSLSFWYHMAGSAVVGLNVDVFSNGNWVNNVFTLTGPQQALETSPWLQANASLSSFAGSTIYFRFRVVCGGGNFFEGDVAVDDIYVGTLSGPVNDNPCGAINLPVSGSCNNTLGSNVMATSTTSVTAPSCGNYAGADVWYKCIVPISGNVNIAASQAIGGIVNGAMAIYKGNCSNLTFINCVDDYMGTGNMPQINLAGQTPGDTIFIRFWTFSNTMQGNFYLCATEPAMFAINPTSTTVLSGAGSTNFTITSNTSWTLSSNQAWLTLNPTSGNGNATIVASYSANSGLIRTAIITAIPAGSANITATLTQAPSLYANFSSSSTACLNSAITFTNQSTNATSYFWFVNGVLKATTTNFTTTFTTSGTQKVSLVASNGTTNDTMHKLLFVPNNPVVFAGNDTTACAGATINFNNASAFGSERCISSCTMPTTYCPSASLNDSYEYITNVLIENAAKNSGRSNVGYEDFSASTFTYLMQDSTYTINVNGYIPGTAYYTEFVSVYIDWNRNGLFDEAAINLGSFNFIGNHWFSGVITVPNTMVLGKTKMRVILKYSAAVTSGCENSYTYGETEDYQIELIKFSNAKVNWTAPNGFSSTVLHPIITNAVVQTNPYTLLATDSFGCSAQDVRTITINPKPTVSLGAIPSICSNSGNITLNQGTPSGGIYSGPGVSGTIFNPQTAGVGTHTITYTYQNGFGCSNSATTTITVNAKPIVSFAALPSVCSNANPFMLSGGSPLGGTYSGTGVSFGQFNPVTTGPGMYPIKYKYTNASGCSDSSTQNQTVILAPTATLGNFAPICAMAAPITLSGGTPAGGTYSGWGVLNGTFNPMVTGAGNQQIIYTYVAPNNCQDTAISYITVNAAPNVSLTNFQSVCINSTPFTLTGGSPVGGIYSGPGVSNGIFNPQLAGIGTHTITYFVTQNGCSNTTQKTITVNTKPIVSFTGLAAATCLNGLSISLTPSPAGGNFTGSGMTANLFNPAVAGIGSHLISYSYTDANNCSAVDTHSVFVNNLPIVNAGTDKTIAQGSSTNLSGTVSAGSGMYGYLWTPTNMVINSNSASTNTVSLLNSQLFTLRGTDQTTSCFSTDEVLVIVTANTLSVNTSANPTSICQGQNTTISAIPTGGNGNYTYSWTSIPAGFTSNQASIIVSPTVNTTYTVNVTDGSLNASSNSSIVVKPKPVLSFSTFADVCLSSIPLPLNGASPSGGTYFGNGVSSGFFTPSTAGVGTHSISYLYTAPNGCSDTISQTIKVNPKPVVSFSALPSLCQSSQPFTLIGGSPFGGIYSGFGVINGSFNPSITGTGTYMIKYTYTNVNNCSDTLSQPITVYSNPIVNAGLDKAIPTGTSTQLSGLVSGGSGNYSFNWSPANLLATTNTATVNTLILNCTALFTLTVNDLTSTCVGSDQMMVVISNGAGGASIQADKTSLCAGDSTKLHAFACGISGTNTYLWSSTPIGFSSILQHPTVNPSVTTTYTVQIFDGMSYFNASLVINVLPKPIVNLGNDTSLCKQSGMLLNAGAGYINYSWSTGSTNQYQIVDVSTLAPGSYTYSVSVTAAIGCKGNDAINVSVGSSKPIHLGNDTVLCKNNKITLDAGTGFTSYLWNNGSSQQTLVVDSLMGFGPKLLFVQAKDAGNCASYDTVVIIISHCGIGFEENGNSINTLIYPNPAKHTLNIVSENMPYGDVLIEILGMDGRLILQKHVLNLTTDLKQQLDVSKLASGVYLIKLVHQDYQHTERIIIQ